MAKLTISQVVSTISTAAIAACAIALTAIAFSREHAKPAATALKDRTTKQRDWMNYALAGHRLGSPAASAVLIEFSDFQCPFCRRFEQTLAAARAKYGKEFAVVYRHYPLPGHKMARPAAIASECAAKQDRFEAFHDAAFTVQDSLEGPGVLAIARKIGVRLPRFRRHPLNPATFRVEVSNEIRTKGNERTE